MGRGLRVQYYGAIYHIVHEGIDGENIFSDDEDKSYLLKLMSESKEVKDFKIFAYTILDNSYNLLIKTLNIPISNIMHSINFKYAKYYNIKARRTGRVFHERYKATLVQDERYLLPIIKYIHRFPVEAQLCNSMEEYKWSSHAFYRMNVESMVNIGEVLDMFSSNRIEAIAKYVEFMEREDENYENIKCMSKNSAIIGTEEFVRDIKGKGNRRSLDELLRQSCPGEDEFNLIKNGFRERSLTQYKIEYIIKAKEEGYTFKEIGENIGVTAAAVRGLVKR